MLRFATKGEDTYWFNKNPYKGTFSPRKSVSAEQLSTAAGMIVERKIAEDAMKRRTDRHDAGSNIRLQDKRKVSAEQRSGRLNQKPFVMWITGLPRSGKSTIAYELEQALFEQQKFVQVLDGEILRLGLNRDLGFNGADRWENQRRAAELARLNMSMGVSTVIALVSPLDFERQQARQIIGDGFIEVFCNAPLETCEARDTHGLYKRARAGEIANVTGIDAPYEEPTKAEIVIDSANETIETNVQQILSHLKDSGLLDS